MGLEAKLTTDAGSMTFRAAPSSLDMSPSRIAGLLPKLMQSEIVCENAYAEPLDFCA